MGKQLILIRHAQAVERQANKSDLRRILTAKGQKQARKLGAYLKQSKLKPQLLLVSNAERSQETGKKLLTTLSGAKVKTAIEPLIYAASSPHELLTQIQALSENWNQVILVGHNPLLKGLLNLLIDTPYLGPIHKGGLVHLNFRQRSWARIAQAEVKEYWCPDKTFAKQLAFYSYLHLGQIFSRMQVHIEEDQPLNGALDNTMEHVIGELKDCFDTLNIED